MKTHTKQKIAAVLVPTALFMGLIAPAFAEDAGTAPVSPTIKTTMRADREAVIKDKALAKSATEIKKREDDLNALLARINAMTKVSAGEKAAIATSIQNTISMLEALKAKIALDTDPATIKADMQSIANSTRVYLLVAPQARILAAADRVGTVADMITAMNAKLQTRITTLSATGADMSAITAAQSDITTKLADAKTQAAAAVSAVAGLVPDAGDQAKLQANQAALKTARAALVVAEKDLKDAQKDVKTIISALKTMNPKVEKTPSPSTTNDN